MSADLTNPVFTDEAAAMAHLEESRWPNGEVSCPHCGSFKVHRMAGKTQAGMFLCNDCRDKFTARVGTVMGRSHVPVHKWLLAIHLLTSSKKGMSAHQLHRMLGVTYKTAWFMAHRIRAAMAPAPDAGPIGGEGKIVEVDETYHGNMDDKTKGKTTIRGKRGLGGKRPIVSLVERGGSVRSFYSGIATKASVTEIVKGNIARESRVFTDESRLYGEVKGHFGEHLTVHHSSGEYVRGEVHTNTIEGYFSVFKRGMKGIYQHCGEKHLHRYLAEFDFRYNYRTALGFNDTDRAAAALKGIEGKRLTYRRPDGSGLHLQS
ncbi:IS1595 family transposase [uncultured Enterovirga sp.]|uniref:IS1595 family transposase n=1 Tax=uncultured Enterovirga sp. TaxID=2026352 RepID=UPI0035CAEF93